MSKPGPGPSSTPSSKDQDLFLCSLQEPDSDPSNHDCHKCPRHISVRRSTSPVGGELSYQPEAFQSIEAKTPESTTCLKTQQLPSQSLVDNHGYLPEVQEFWSEYILSYVRRLAYVDFLLELLTQPGFGTSQPEGNVIEERQENGCIIIIQASRKRCNPDDIAGPITSIQTTDIARPAKCLKIAIVSPSIRHDDEEYQSNASFSDEEREDLDDVQLWSNTQVRVWDSVTFSSERDEESVTVRSQTPYAGEEEAASIVDADAETVGDELRSASLRHESNERLMADYAVEIEASVAMNRRGGGRRKLTELALDQVIKRKKMSLFCPVNTGNKLCFCICLVHFLDPQLPESELENRANVIQNNAGLTSQDPIGLHDIARFENLLGVKIIVFYRTNDGGLETYKN
ncbi:uncharacterized protein LOC107686231 [Sinocyclocheilus anshuiensis]|uniref:uncharacterized protein LOC107686231 n=1 Tax=Sinocyclocheilus anshuiensis TaxID=1608454 RepID=UPI0007B9A12E|nr:PREDICTED: uncharacterized protein LOC107686231 [Sinocyclocheilus anshuiensis]